MLALMICRDKVKIFMILLNLLVKKKTLILDLDETLIHTLDSGEHDPDVTVYFKS